MSDWTIDTLKEYLTRIIDEHDKRYEERFQAQESAVNSALVSAEKAVVKAENASEKRFENTNEWRQVVNDRDVLFARAKEVDSKFDNVYSELKALSRLVYVGLGIVLLAAAAIGWIVKH